MSTDSFSDNRQPEFPFQTFTDSFAVIENKLRSLAALFQTFEKTFKEITAGFKEMETAVMQTKTVLAGCEPQMKAEQQWGKIFSGMQQLLSQLSTDVPNLGQNLEQLTVTPAIQTPQAEKISNPPVHAVPVENVAEDDFEVIQPQTEHSVVLAGSSGEGFFSPTELDDDFDLLDGSSQPISSASTSSNAVSTPVPSNTTASNVTTDETIEEAKAMEDDFEIVLPDLQSTSSMVPVSAISPDLSHPDLQSTSTTTSEADDVDFELGVVKSDNVVNISEFLKSFSTTIS